MSFAVILLPFPNRWYCQRRQNAARIQASRFYPGNIYKIFRFEIRIISSRIVKNSL